jgi:hypothetical protein
VCLGCHHVDDISTQDGVSRARCFSMIERADLLRSQRSTLSWASCCVIFLERVTAQCCFSAGVNGTSFLRAGDSLSTIFACKGGPATFSTRLLAQVYSLFWTARPPVTHQHTVKTSLQQSVGSGVSKPQHCGLGHGWEATILWFELSVSAGL